MRRSTSARSATVLIGWIACLSALAGPAWAHDTLVSSEPAKDAALTVAPTVVSLTFNAVVSNPTVVVVDDQGTPKQQGAASITDRTATQAVDGLSSGGYLINYRVVSSDGHPITGQIPFTVGGGQNDPPGTVNPSQVANTSADTGSNTMIWYLVGGVVLLGLVGFLGAGMRSRGGGTDAP